MESGRDVDHETRALVDCLSSLSGPVVLVGNEVGLGGVAENALARRFADRAGTLNQTVALVADRVVLVVAGLPWVVKDVKNGHEERRQG